MAAKRDYYDVLGIARGASQEEIKRAFRARARQYHPDVSKEADAEERFKEVNEAYAVLSDERKRATYDRYGHAGVDQSPGTGADPFYGFTVSDIFDEFFGASTRSRQRAPRRGQDLPYRLTIDFIEALFGAEREIEFERTDLCDRCDGVGAEPGTDPQVCPTCGGAGEVRQARQTLLGQIVNITTCPNCRGTGRVIVTPCRQCSGSGQIRRSRRLTVSVPAGVDHGTQIRITGEGEPGVNGGPPGNLYIAISVRPHEYFRRRGDDLFVKVSINVAQAALGHTVMVPVLTAQGEIEEALAIPSGTQSGEVIVLKGRGVPRLRRDGTHTGFGDLQVMIEVRIPKRLTPEQEALFLELGTSLGEAIIPPANEKGFFERVIDWLGGSN